MATEYLDLDDAFDAYAEAVEVSVDQARSALVNPAQFESALARPQNAAAYEGADIARQAATLFWRRRERFSRWQQTYRGRPAALIPQPERVDMTLTEDEIFELAVGTADAHLSVDNVEATLRPAVVPL